MKRLFAFAVAILLSTLSVAESPKPVTRLTGKVVKVADGDTLTLRVGTKNVVIRLAGIDAPEDGQDFSKVSRQALVRHVSGKEVNVRVTDKDRYGRTVGIIYLDGACINTELVKEGLAWHYTEYSDSTILAAAEQEARETKVGLWSDEHPLEPWAWRSQRAKEIAAKEAAAEEQVKATKDAVAQDREAKALLAKQQAEEKQRAKSSPSQPPRVTKRASTPEPPPAPTRSVAAQSHWLNTSTNVRHNSGCRYYRDTKSGRVCGPSEGKACGICGG